MDDRAATVLRERYQLIDELGEGNQGDAYLAVDEQTGDTVVVKELALQRVSDWKAVELFEREAEVLRTLDFAFIPSYVDAFHVGDGTDRQFYLVQQYVDGPNLEEAVAGGLHCDEDGIVDMARQMLEILDYLHSQKPPVLHRDIKPSNIIRRTGDGRLFLVDFGAVGRFENPERSGSTRVGTAGYVPIEQMMGQATPASDLYALGATLVFLMTRKQPYELPEERTRPKFREFANVSEPLAALVDRLLAADVEKRPQSAAECLELLKKCEAARAAKTSGEHLPALVDGGSGTALTLPEPVGTNIEISRHRGYLCATLGGSNTMMSADMEAPDAIAASVVFFGVFGLLELLGSDINSAMKVAVVLAYVVVVMGIFAARSYFSDAPFSFGSTRTICSLTDQGFRVEREFLKLRWGQRMIGLDAFAGLHQTQIPTLRGHRPGLAVRGAEMHIPGSDKLSDEERAWLVELFDEAVRELDGGEA